MSNSYLLSDKAFNLQKSLFIAVDGPSASGKSHLSQELAKILHLTYIESGILYRIVAKNCIDKQILPNEESILVSGVLDIIYDMFEHEYDYASLRNEQISLFASQVATISILRKKINFYLQELVLEHSRVIMDGRDIGNVVLPNADLKIFLTADLRSRAQRRSKQFFSEGVDLDFSEILSKLESRDRVDMERDVDPLLKGSSSLVIDSTNLTFSALVERVLLFIKSN